MKATDARRRVYGYIKRHPGATDRHIQQGLRMGPNTERPRRVELERAGLIGTNGMGRTPTGHAAFGWAVTEKPYPDRWVDGNSVDATASGLAFVRRAIFRLFPVSARTPKVERLLSRLERELSAGKRAER